MKEISKNQETLRIVDFKYRQIMATSVVIFIGALVILFVLKGEEYFWGGLVIGAIYFFSFLFSKNLETIKIADEMILFEYYVFGLIKQESKYDIKTIYTEAQKTVAFKGGVNYKMKFYTLPSKKIFEISIRDLKERNDFRFLDRLLSKRPLPDQAFE